MKYALVAFFVALLIGALFVWLFFISSFSSTLGPLSDRLNVFQAAITFLAFLIALPALVEYLHKSSRKMKPHLLIATGSGDIAKAVSLEFQQFPAQESIRLQIGNKGKMLIGENELCYMIFIPQGIYEGVKGSIRDPYQTADHKPGLRDASNALASHYALGEFYPFKIFPDHHGDLFTLNCKFSKPGLYKLQYFFYTVEGVFPRRVKPKETPIKHLDEIQILVEKKK